MTLTSTPRAVALLAVALALTDTATDTATAAATNTPGALFQFSSEPVANDGPRPSVAHVAISLGTGNRWEARRRRRPERLARREASYTRGPPLS